jgi:hypothetical protein
MQHDRWHTMRIDEHGAAIGDHDLNCPTHPDGPRLYGSQYGCLTYVNLRRPGGQRYPEVHQLGVGEYRIRYWWSDEDGTDGYEVEAA